MNSYKTQIFEVNNEFVLVIDELNLIAKDTSLDEAYKKINSEKESYLSLMKESGLELPGHSKVTGHTSSIKDFILKSIIITSLSISLFAVCGFIGGMSFKKGMKSVASKLSERTEDISKLTEEEKLELFKEKLKIFKPYLLEVKKAVDE